MNWKIITPPPAPLLTSDDVMEHLRIDDEDQSTYVETLIAAAVSNAEERMEASLLTRTIRATFFSGDQLYLPRGPIQSITSVAINGIVQSSATYSVESQGYADILRYNNGNIQPLAAPRTLVVTYTAGYGDTPDTVPPDILQVIRCHVGLLYENRETASEGRLSPVPFIDEFFKLRSRGVGIG